MYEAMNVAFLLVETAGYPVKVTCITLLVSTEYGIRNEIS